MSSSASLIAKSYPRIGLVSGWGYPSDCWPEPQPELAGAVQFFSWQSLLAPRATALAAKADDIEFWVGWSLGGSVLMHALAQQQIKARGLLLLSATPCFCQQADGWPGMAEAQLVALQHAVARNPTAALRQFYRAFALTPPPEYQSVPEQLANSVGLEFLRQQDLRAELTRLSQTTDVAVLTASDDPLVSPNWPEHSDARLRWAVVPNQGHDWPQTPDCYRWMIEQLFNSNGSV